MERPMDRAAGFLGSGAIGVGAAAAMFGALAGMLTGGGDVAFERTPPRSIEFRFVPPEERPPTRRPDKPVRDPAAPPPHVMVDGGTPCLACDGTSRFVAWTPPNPPGRGTRAFVPGGAQGIDTDATPIVRILPEYPPGARGDGFVLVQFDVATSGAVENARVVAAEPRGPFERAALRAIERWRYRPAVVDGRAVSRRGMQVRLSFNEEHA